MLKQELEKKLYELQDKHAQLLKERNALQHQYDALDATCGEYRQELGEVRSVIADLFRIALNIPDVQNELMRVVEENIHKTTIIENAVEQAVEWIEDAPYRRAMES